MHAAVRNQCAGPFGAVYDFYIERPKLMAAIGHAVWGIDASLLYSSLAAIEHAGDGAIILDVPCGGGIALRALRPGQDVRYVGADICQRMLARAARRADMRGLGQAEFVRADMLSLPFEDERADLVLSLSGLHMVAQPHLAIRELIRCLKPGGELVGSTFLREGSWRQRKMFDIGHRRGHALPPRASALYDWLAAGGIERPQIEPQAGFAVFRGKRTQAI